MAEPPIPLSEIDSSVLEPIVGGVLGKPVSIKNWTCSTIQGAPISGQPQAKPEEAASHVWHRLSKVDEARRQFLAKGKGTAVGRSVYHFSGEAQSGESVCKWSVVLKVQADSHRERLAFESGLLSDLPDGVTAPVCYSAQEFSDGSYWLWLEAVDDEIDSWPLERFGSAARHIGRFNGIHLGDGPIPTHDWFQFKPSNNWDLAGEVLDQLKGVRHHPLIALAFPDDVADGVDRLFANRHRLQEALVKLPRTLSHLDAHRGNLFTRRRGGTVETVLIDWGGVGTAAVGVEIHQLAASFRSLRDMDMDRVYEVSDAVFGNFVSGLEDMGWKGDPRQVRLGFAASIALCTGLGELKSIMRGGLDEKSRRRVRELWGDRPIEENMARRGELLRFIFRLADEADVLMDRLSLN